MDNLLAWFEKMLNLIRDNGQSAALNAAAGLKIQNGQIMLSVNGSNTVFPVYWLGIYAAAALLIFISWCVLLHKARLGWGWMFCPIMNQYKRAKLGHAAWMYLTTVFVLIVSVVLIVVGGDAGAVLVKIGAILFCVAALMILIYTLIHRFLLSRAFGRGAGFGIGLLLLPVIFLPILAFGKSEYSVE